MIDELKACISGGNVRGILNLMFEAVDGIPVVRGGFHHERNLWDFKSDVPGSGKGNEAAWANIARHVLAFHNADGGILIFGIDDRTFGFTKSSHYCDSARFNNAIRKYIGD